MKAGTGLLRNEENKTGKTKQLVCTECIAKWIKVTEIHLEMRTRLWIMHKYGYRVQGNRITIKVMILLKKNIIPF